MVRKGHNRDVDSYSAFFENDRRSDTGLDEYLKKEGVKRVYVVGLAYDFCVKYTALDAKRLGYDAYVVRDCCAGVALPGTMEAAETGSSRTRASSSSRRFPRSARLLFCTHCSTLAVVCKQRA